MRRAYSLLALLALAVPMAASPAEVCGRNPGDQQLYLTFDTGHMGVAPLVAEVLARQQVRVTFFLANEKTLTDGTSLLSFP